jgi:hypothetical protein
MVHAKPVWKQMDFLRRLYVYGLGILACCALVIIVEIHYVY